MYGCTKELWLELRDIGLAMIAAGKSADTTPLRAFTHQRDCSIRRRKIDWRLTLPEWWSIWEASGRWNERGMGRGYMMCRIGDRGAYEVGNVYIGPGAENLSAAAKKTNLPIGVAYSRKSKNNPYRAYCNIGGKQRHIGMFPTIEAAREAYVQARDLDMASRKAEAA